MGGFADAQDLIIGTYFTVLILFIIVPCEHHKICLLCIGTACIIAGILEIMYIGNNNNITGTIRSI